MNKFLKSLVKVSYLVIIIFYSNFCFSQTVIKLKNKDGVQVISCYVNNIPMEFVFDTGASDVTISITEALFMLKNGSLKKTDILGSQYFSDATGEISEGTKIIIRKLKVGNLELFDVPATIVHNSNAPLLFGQTAIKRFGKYFLDNEAMTITINNTNQNIRKNNMDDYYIINIKAVKEENDAKLEVEKLKNSNYKADYLWIPNYSSLSGNNYFSIYIGPFRSEKFCKKSLTELREIFPLAYGSLISKTGRKQRIN
jgi:clan AA aspartic protease (TIGR02281 family)